MDFVISVVSRRPKISVHVRSHAKSDMQYLFKAVGHLLEFSHGLFWARTLTLLHKYKYMCASLCQLKPRFDVICASITARCDLFKINVSKHGQSINIKGKRLLFLTD